LRAQPVRERRQEQIPEADARKERPMRKSAGVVQIGVVGCGYWGPNLIRNFSSLGQCKLAAICDVNSRRLLHMSTRYPGAVPFGDFEELLKTASLDAVAVATPVQYHYQLAKAALEAGKHVFIEKPMAASADHCRELVALASAKRKTLMVGHTFLFSPAVRKMKEIVESGEIGDIRYISCRRLNLGLFQKDINVTWDLAPHDLSITMFLMNEWPCGVNCQGNANVHESVEDVTNMSLFFPGGGFATVHNSWLDPRKVREMTVVGSKKMIVYDDLEAHQKLRIYDQRVEVPPHYDTFAEFQYSYHYGDMWSPFIKQEEPLKVECQHFIDCILKRKKPLSDGRYGWELVRILEAASVSLRNHGNRVDIPPID
jgi:predicted dehydrogenase